MRIPRSELFEGDTDDDTLFAQELVSLLNDLIVDENIRTAIDTLIKVRVEFPPGDVARDLLDHNGIQVYSPTEGAAMLGVLGLLNGLAGINGDGSGRVGASYSASGDLLRFYVYEGADPE
jgi:hypothetical protein